MPDGKLYGVFRRMQKIETEYNEKEKHELILDREWLWKHEHKAFSAAKHREKISDQVKIRIVNKSSGSLSIQYLSPWSKTHRSMGDDILQNQTTELTCKRYGMYVICSTKSRLKDEAASRRKKKKLPPYKTSLTSFIPVKHTQDGCKVYVGFQDQYENSLPWTTTTTSAEQYEKWRASFLESFQKFSENAERTYRYYTRAINYEEKWVNAFDNNDCEDIGGDGGQEQTENKKEEEKEKKTEAQKGKEKNQDVVSNSPGKDSSTVVKASNDQKGNVQKKKDKEDQIDTEKEKSANRSEPEPKSDNEKKEEEKEKANKEKQQELKNGFASTADHTKTEKEDPVSYYQWTDPTFYPHRLRVKGIPPTTVQWSRHQALTKHNKDLRWRLFHHGVSPLDVAQGKLGNCWFLSALAVLAERPELVKNLFVTWDEFIPKLGAVPVRLWDYQGYRTEIVDNLLPNSGGRFIFSRGRHNELWVPLLEKAYAKMVGGYVKLDGGNCADGLHALTGAPTKVYFACQIERDMDLYWNKLKQDFAKNYLVCLSTFLTGIDKYQQEAMGLVSRHAYSCLGAYEVQQHPGGPIHRLVRIRNPHAEHEWTGDWADNSGMWTETALKCIPPHEHKNDGIFYMALEDLTDYFVKVVVCKVKTGWYEWHTNSIWRQFVTDQLSSRVYVFNLRQIIEIEVDRSQLPLHLNVVATGKIKTNWCEKHMDVFSIDGERLFGASTGRHASQWPLQGHNFHIDQVLTEEMLESYFGRKNGESTKSSDDNHKDDEKDQTCRLFVVLTGISYPNKKINIYRPLGISVRSDKPLRVRSRDAYVSNKRNELLHLSVVEHHQRIFQTTQIPDIFPNGEKVTPWSSFNIWRRDVLNFQVLGSILASLLATTLTAPLRTSLIHQHTLTLNLDEPLMSLYQVGAKLHTKRGLAGLWRGNAYFALALCLDHLNGYSLHYGLGSYLLKFMGTRVCRENNLKYNQNGQGSLIWHWNEISASKTRKPYRGLGTYFATEFVVDFAARVSSNVLLELYTPGFSRASKTAQYWIKRYSSRALSSALKAPLNAILTRIQLENEPNSIKVADELGTSLMSTGWAGVFHYTAGQILLDATCLAITDLAKFLWKKGVTWYLKMSKGGRKIVHIIVGVTATTAIGGGIVLAVSHAKMGKQHRIQQATY